MGEQFWWFYDVIAVAIILVVAFLSGKSGAIKSVLHLAGYGLSFIIALSICGGIGNSLYSGSVGSNNQKKLAKNLPEVTIIESTTDYLNAIYPQVLLDNRQLEKIYLDPSYKSLSKVEERVYVYANSRNAKQVDTKENFINNLHAGYAEYFRLLVKDGMNNYAAETAAKKILDKPEIVYEILPRLLNKEEPEGAATYIAYNLIQEPYIEIIRLTAFAIFFAIGCAITLFVIKGLSKIQRDSSIGSRAAAASLGIVSGLMFAVLAAAVVRLNVILGNNKMLFFNFEAVDKSYVFKYFYKFIMSKTS